MNANTLKRAGVLQGDGLKCRVLGQRGVNKYTIGRSSDCLCGEGAENAKYNKLLCTLLAALIKTIAL
ncbi:hypothetical protein PoB_007191800 [Plakobranchus ocellatus]|uniref:Uncharacterized protein n=1 Tax=Plakobranchus ocellatus TaxID=259542 RepID=A0AAV4DMW2_9GAST|nr:hypothetical protein PoB_007191800 [Plakobranchus ocellatus]